MRSNILLTKPQAPSRRKHLLLHVLLYLGIALLLLIPTYIAIGHYVIEKNRPDTEVKIVYTAMSMTGPTGSTTTATQDERGSLLKIFVSLLEDSEIAFGVPSTHTGSPYVVVMQGELADETFRFFFSNEYNDCYYTAPNGSCYRSDHEAVSTFLSSSYAYELYAGATLPVLTTAATDEVTPYSVTWHYRARQSFTQLSQTTADTALYTYPIANDIAFYFSIQPSNHEVVIRRDGTELYRGNAKDIALTLQGQDDILDFEINAFYNQDSRLDYYGALQYRFRMQVVEAARFTLNTNTTESGGFFLLDCENVKNPQNLEITATPALPSDPVILQRGNRVCALLPAGAAAQRTLRVTYGTITADFDLTVTPADTLSHSPDTSALRGDWVTLLGSTLPTLIAQKGATQDTDTLTPHSTLGTPTGTLAFGYGDTVTVAGTALDGSPLPFSLYTTTSPIRALCAGRVIEVGQELHLGRYVIVDHGCGLYTWYGGLSETRVRAGDILAVGDTVGLPSTTLYHESSALVMATLGKSAVCVEYLTDHPLLPTA